MSWDFIIREAIWTVNAGLYIGLGVSWLALGRQSGGRLERVTQFVAISCFWFSCLYGALLLDLVAIFTPGLLEAFRFGNLPIVGSQIVALHALRKQTTTVAVRDPQGIREEVSAP